MQLDGPSANEKWAGGIYMYTVRLESEITVDYNQPGGPVDINCQIERQLHVIWSTQHRTARVNHTHTHTHTHTQTHTVNKIHPIQIKSSISFNSIFVTLQLCVQLPSLPPPPPPLGSSPVSIPLITWTHVYCSLAQINLFRSPEVYEAIQGPCDKNSAIKPR